MNDNFYDAAGKKHYMEDVINGKKDLILCRCPTCSNNWLIEYWNDNKCNFCTYCGERISKLEVPKKNNTPGPGSNTNTNKKQMNEKELFEYLSNQLIDDMFSGMSSPSRNVRTEISEEGDVFGLESIVGLPVLVKTKDNIFNGVYKITGLDDAAEMLRLTDAADKGVWLKFSNIDYIIEN